jgi:TPR repeat protein
MPVNPDFPCVVEAQFQLGRFFQRPRKGREQDLKKARFWLQKASLNRHIMATITLAYICMLEKSHDMSPDFNDFDVLFMRFCEYDKRSIGIKFRFFWDEIHNLSEESQWDNEVFTREWES